VGVKQIPDLEKIRIKADTREPVLEGLPVLFGDFDKCAIEEAVRIKEKGGGAEVVVVSIGPENARGLPDRLCGCVPGNRGESGIYRQDDSVTIGDKYPLNGMCEYAGSKF